MNLDLVSVIIPCYNNAGFIKKCVQSVLSQTYSQIEIIIVDDGSEDDITTLLSDIKDQRLKKVCSIPHSGVSTARNVGIKKAQGDYILFIDGDDWIEPNHVELLIQSLNEAECAMAMMSIDYPDRTEAQSILTNTANSAYIIKKENFNILFENYSLSSPCNKIYISKYLKGSSPIKFDESISYGEDVIFNLEYLSQINSIKIVPQATYHYVKHEFSSSTRYHSNTSYTLTRLSHNIHELLGANLTEATLVILMRHYLWGILNLHHKDSTLNTSQTRIELSRILVLPEYKKGKSVLKKLQISNSLQLLLRYGSPSIINYVLTRYIH